MKRTLSALLCAVLALSLALPLGARALAEGYPAGQSYSEDKSGVEVYTVQVAATELDSGASQLRASMLAAGYDCFVYCRDELYYIMCGKFSAYADAEVYRNSIISNTSRSRAYVTTAWVPEADRQLFESVYAAGEGVVSKDTAESARSYALVNLALAPDTFDAEQYYEPDAAAQAVYTVQVSAHYGRETAEFDRDRMLAAGYDSFVYYDGGVFCVMCGKFPSSYEALCYSEAIHTDPARYSSFVTLAYLPAAAIQRFETRLNEFVTIPQDAKRMETYWERPTGAYYRSDLEGAVEVYTVEFSQGSSFTSSESRRDELEAKGYPAFCYKVLMAYKTMTGMFTDKAEAQRYCQEIRTAGESGASVTTASVPQSALDSFRSWYEGR